MRVSSRGLAPAEHADWARERGFEVTHWHDPAALESGPALGGTGVKSYGFYHVLVARRAADRPLGAGPPTGATTAEGVPAGASPTQDAAAPAASQADLLAQVLSVLRATLGEEGEGVDEDSSFMDIGMESIEVTKLAQGIQKLTGRELGEAAIFENDSARALASHLSAPAV